MNDAEKEIAKYIHVIFSNQKKEKDIHWNLKKKINKYTCIKHRNLT